MFHFAPKTKRPKLPDLPADAVCLVHDHTHASCKYAVAWLQRKSKESEPKRACRLQYPCCASRICEDPLAHWQSGCEAEPRFTIDAWPDDFAGFNVVDVTPEWIERTKTWVRERADALHRTVDLLTGESPVRAFCRRERALGAGRTEDETRALVAARFALHPDDVQLPDETLAWSEWLPMALCENPVPFEREEVARLVLAVVKRQRHALRAPPGFAALGDNQWVATSEQGDAGVVTRLPWGTSARDWPSHVDESTHARARFRGPPMSLAVTWELRAIESGAPASQRHHFRDPHDYVRAWLVVKFRDMAERASSQTEWTRARATFLRSIYIGRRFVDVHNNSKREYLDETSAQKRRRVSLAFGPEHADALLRVPIGEVGPDFECESAEGGARKRAKRRSGVFRDLTEELCERVQRCAMPEEEEEEEEEDEEEDKEDF